MSASAEGLVHRFDFQADPPGTSSVLGKARKETTEKISIGNAGTLIGAASLYVALTAGLLWSAPAWMVVLGPLVQSGVARSLYCNLGGGEHR